MGPDDLTRSHAMQDALEVLAPGGVDGPARVEPLEVTDAQNFLADEQQPLDSLSRYVLRGPVGGIPTDSFWSFTMYEATADGRRFFVGNPIGRCSIGNRTDGLVVASDGSMEIALQRTSPAEPQLRANWLPTPAGTFQIALRCYAPRAELREGRVAMPGIVRLDA